MGIVETLEDTAALSGWDSYNIDLERLLQRTDFYARLCGASDDTRGEAHPRREPSSPSNGGQMVDFSRG